MIEREWTLLKEFLIYSEHKQPDKLTESKQFGQFVLKLFVWTKVRWLIIGWFLGVLSLITILYFLNIWTRNIGPN